MDRKPQHSVPPAGPHDRYTRVAVALHWSIAIFVLLNLAIGPFMEGMRLPIKPLAILLHISSGITVLALTIARVVWRLTHRPPPLLTTSRWEAFAARTVHLLLYTLMLALPLTGWAMISANPPPGVVQGAPPNRGRPPMIWGLLKLPLMAPIQQMGAKLEGVPHQQDVHDNFVRAHAAGGFLMMFLVALHILGGLKHEFFDGGGELRRMTFGREPGKVRGRKAG